MTLANLGGRATVVVEDADGQARALDVEEASGGALGADPMLLSDLAHHDALRELAEEVEAESQPVLDQARLGPPVTRAGVGP